MTTPLTITSLNQGKIAPRYTSDETYWAQFQSAPKPAPVALPRQNYLKFVRALWPVGPVSAKG